MHLLRFPLMGGFCVTGLLLSLWMCSTVLICLLECFSGARFLLSLISGSRPRLSHRFSLPEHPSAIPPSYSPGTAVCGGRRVRAARGRVLPQQPAWIPSARRGEPRPVTFIEVASTLPRYFLRRHYSAACPASLLAGSSSPRKHIFCFSGDLCTCYSAESEGDQLVPCYLGLPNFKIGVLRLETPSVPGKRAWRSPCFNASSPHLTFLFLLSLPSIY